VLCHLQPSVPGQRAPQGRGEFEHVLAQRGNDRRGIFAGHFNEHDETRVPFHQGRDMGVFTACKQVALPVAGNGAVFNLRRSFADRDRIHDLTAGLSRCPRVP
jgi:hypothetical protein